ncbi:BMP family ABC transporter substrate-binding protein [Synechococcales cyanobacterium C]|uniref:BMP family ABC transporter substrate-binding protein n=1 Tax=Petrachloros mirabilis ULC683 TaxID=2781853 RepID=A0A8K1ZV75_9CYAN|nr:BMP family ABC transporter substrate-binding protein [Petrachloros mirabilis]NCJ05835.1 BMP family ABC transporter substrate-binding protein [Petrachloros mirabilis ULC683]
MRTKKTLYLPRRQVLQGLLGLAAFGVTTKLSSCSSSSEGGAESGSSTESLTVGFLYVGAKDDYGFNQAHAEGAAAIGQLPGVKVVEQANVPETTEAQEAMRNMIEEDGATVLFPTSFGYFDPHILRIAQEYPEVQFFHYGALYEEGKTPPNIGSYFGDVDEAQFISGQVAALTSKKGKLGFVAAKPVTPVLRNLNSFLLGARNVKPDITMQVIL